MLRRKRLLQEKEEEDREINEYYLRIDYMYENCSGHDQSICGLLEEQRELLNALSMKNRE